MDIPPKHATVSLGPTVPELHGPVRVHTQGPSIAPSARNKEERSKDLRAVLAWIFATTLIPLLYTSAPVIIDASWFATVDQGQLVLLAISASVGGIIIELRQGSERAGRFLLQLSHISVALFASVFFAMLQKALNGRVTTVFSPLQIWISVALALGACATSSISVVLERLGSK